MDRSNFLKRALGVSLLPFVPRTLTPDTPALEAIQPEVCEPFVDSRTTVVMSATTWSTGAYTGYAHLVDIGWDDEL